MKTKKIFKVYKNFACFMQLINLQYDYSLDRILYIADKQFINDFYSHTLFSFPALLKIL